MRSFLYEFLPFMFVWMVGILLNSGVIALTGSHYFTFLIGAITALCASGISKLTYEAYA